MLRKYLGTGSGLIPLLMEFKIEPHASTEPGYRVLHMTRRTRVRMQSWPQAEPWLCFSYPVTDFRVPVSPFAQSLMTPFNITLLQHISWVYSLQIYSLKTPIKMAGWLSRHGAQQEHQEVGRFRFADDTSEHSIVEFMFIVVSCECQDFAAISFHVSIVTTVIWQKDKKKTQIHNNYGVNSLYGGETPLEGLKTAHLHFSA